MKYLDAAVQTAGFVLGLIILAGGIDGDRLSGILVLQMCMGAWQLLSCIISVVATRAFRTAKLKGLAAFFIYTVTLRSAPESEIFSIILWTVPAWSLAVVYYVITWKWVLAGTGRRGKFLPHLNF